MKRWAVGIAVLLMVLSGAAPIQGGILYSVTDLGDLPGGEDASQAFAINSTGQVVGQSETADGRRAFLWQNGVMTDLGVVSDGHDWSVARDINDHGQVVGQSQAVGVSLSSRPFLYSDGAMTDLGSFGGGYGFANGISNAGDVVGLSRYDTNPTHAFRWSNGSMIDLDPTGGYSRAEGINDLGQVVGASGPNRGFLWQNGQMSDLGDLLGGSGRTLAFEINNLSQVIGYSGPLDPGTSYPFIWQDGVMEHLGSVSDPTPFGYARGINDLGEVVGVVADGPFIWDRAGGMRNLNDLLDESGDGWVLTHAYDINDSGQIVGFGRNPDGYTHAFLLTVIPEPSTFIIWSLLGALTITVGWWRRRRAA